MTGRPVRPTPARRHRLGQTRSSPCSAALDDAAEYKRDRAATCADCTEQPCTTCQWRLQAADAYDHLAAQLIQAAEASAARQHAPGHPAPAAESRMRPPTRRPDSDPPPSSPSRAHGHPTRRATP